VKIQDSIVFMLSTSKLFQIYKKDESLKTWIGSERPDFEGQKISRGQISGTYMDILELSDEAKTKLTASKTSLQETQDCDSVTIDISDKDKQKILLLERMIESITGKKFKFHILDKIKIDRVKVGLDLQAIKQEGQPQQKQGWGLEFDSRQAYYEAEKMSFLTEGIVKTADGREINFSVQLNMSREFYAEQNISVRAEDAVKVDPLVINFNGAAPRLTDVKYSFDIDSDGKSDQISFVSPGSGFLILDKNGDGIVNNGNELFGPTSGNGFAELAKYDSDSNNWIDENDDIYNKLRIWTKDENGNDVLFALGQKGIGAIYLGNISTFFDIKDSGNTLQGSVNSSGIYLNEDGTAGTIQHIDLVV